MSTPGVLRPPERVELPDDLTERAAARLLLPRHAGVALIGSSAGRWTCEGVLLLAWRLAGRPQVELEGLDPQLASCLTDWLQRVADFDLSAKRLAA